MVASSDKQLEHHARVNSKTLIFIAKENRMLSCVRRLLPLFFHEILTKWHALHTFRRAAATHFNCFRCRLSCLEPLAHLRLQLQQRQRQQEHLCKRAETA